MSCPVTVRTLLEGWCEDAPNIVITGLALDSRRVEAGQAFVAVAGGSAHGMAYVRQAVARGASVVLHDAGAAPEAMLGRYHPPRPSTSRERACSCGSAGA